MTARLIELGFEIVASSPDAFAQTMKTDYERFGVIVRSARIKAD
jgi:hypothetical protein